MAEIAEQEGVDLKSSSVRIMIHAGEPGALVPAIRDKIKIAWGATPYDYPGLTEVGAYALHCRHQEQSIHINESEFIAEIIDPKTGQPMPEGEIGEMVLTNLGRSCSPGIRFRTGDLVKLRETPCACGRTFRLLEGGILGRSDEMIPLRGMNIFPSKVGEIVEGHLEVGEEYRMIAHTIEGINDFKVMVELNKGRNTEDTIKNIREDLRQHFEIRLDVEAVPPGTLPRSDYKSKRFLDKRQG
jgi:phenylacetate-CoA ligase